MFFLVRPSGINYLGTQSSVEVYSGITLPFSSSILPLQHSKNSNLVSIHPSIDTHNMEGAEHLAGLFMEIIKVQLEKDTQAPQGHNLLQLKRRSLTIIAFKTTKFRDKWYRLYRSELTDHICEPACVCDAQICFVLQSHAMNNQEPVLNIMIWVLTNVLGTKSPPASHGTIVATTTSLSNDGLVQRLSTMGHI